MLDSVPIIDILCKVVDNYGDIGIAYRLARAISALPSPPRLRLIVDDLGAFASLAPGIDSAAAIQEFQGWTVVSWDGGEKDDTARRMIQEEFRDYPPKAVVESLACGRPDWFEEILFDAENPQSRLIIDLEHLTAEPYAIEFHKMPSLTRSSLVNKAMFLPGFVDGTGGLILDPAFMAARETALSPLTREAFRASVARKLGLLSGSEACHWVLVFGYERNYEKIVRDLAAFHNRRPLMVFAAAGKSQEPFLRATRRLQVAFETIPLPFLCQETWDMLVLAADFSIIRGEDSLSRACLSGRPFLWQAYPQEKRVHLRKVEAFIDWLEPYLDADLAPILREAFLAFNARDVDAAETAGDEAILPLLLADYRLGKAFLRVASCLLAQGDLAANLVTFLREIG